MKPSAGRKSRTFLLIAFFVTGLQPHGKAATDLTIYTESLESSWQNWSWDTTVNTAAIAPVRAGSRSMAVTYTAAWAGLYLHANSTINLAEYDHLTFWINGGAGNQQLRVVANGDGGNAFPVQAQANTWVKIDISLNTFGNPATLSDLYWQDAAGGAQPTFYLDDILLVASTGPPPPPPPPGAGPALTVNIGAERHSISEDIYGMNYADEQLAADLRLPVRRWGGNSTTRYNWQLDVRKTDFIRNDSGLCIESHRYPCAARDLSWPASFGDGTSDMLRCPGHRRIPDLWRDKIGVRALFIIAFRKPFSHSLTNWAIARLPSSSGFCRLSKAKAPCSFETFSPGDYRS